MPVLNVGKAHQRLVREEKAKTEPTPDIDLSPDNATVRPITREQAKKVIMDYEWLGCMPAIGKYFFGIFFGDHLAGVTVFGTEYSENLGIWDKYGFTGKMILLARGACVHWAPKYAGSMLIRKSIDLLPKDIEVVTATVDELAGEIGTIYQACGFHYVGCMRAKNPKTQKGNKDRFAVLIDGKLYGSRSIRAKIGCQRKEEILKHWPNSKIEFITQKAKSRYFCFRGSRKVQKQHTKAISHITEPYPKRTGDHAPETLKTHRLSERYGSEK
jgi:hypothetical protein